MTEPHCASVDTGCEGDAGCEATVVEPAGELERALFDVNASGEVLLGIEKSVGMLFAVKVVGDMLLKLGTEDGMPPGAEEYEERLFASELGSDMSPELEIEGDTPLDVREYDRAPVVGFDDISLVEGLMLVEGVDTGLLGMIEADDEGSSLEMMPLDIGVISVPAELVGVALAPVEKVLAASLLETPAVNVGVYAVLAVLAMLGV